MDAGGVCSTQDERFVKRMVLKTGNRPRTPARREPVEPPAHVQMPPDLWIIAVLNRKGALGDVEI